VKRLDRCRICSGAEMSRYLDLGTQPLANAYADSIDLTLPRYPLAVERCRRCGHQQLSVVVDPTDMFEEYLWVSGTTETQRRHFADLAGEAGALVERVRSRQPSVLDIGCNDGALLDAFHRLGFATYGVDPAKNLLAISLGKGHRVLAEHWSPAVAASLRAAHGGVDLVTGCNVFAHCDDLVGFLNGCREALAPGGRVILEFPYARLTLEHYEFDQVYHEHLSYFLAGPFRVLCDSTSWDIVAVKQTPIHGGSIRFTLRPSSARAHAPEVAALEEAERQDGFLADAFYAGYSRRVEERHHRLRALIETCHDEGSRLVAYGASAKGNTMLNYWTDVAPAYMVDDNPLKCGRYTPGRSIPILASGALEREPGRLAILLTAWNFAEEIQERLRARGRRGDVLLTYVPVVKAEILR
jgi:SAM-dependent methyltransferase